MPLCGSSSAKPSFGRGRPIQRKVVVVGDGACGKTSLLNVFTRGFFTQVYEPTVFENYVHDLVVDNQVVELSLWDTAVRSKLRIFCTALAVLTRLFTLQVDNPTSLDNIEAKWLDEILEYCPGVKLVLVALKCDLRDDVQTKERLARYGMQTIRYEEGLSTARRIRASRYLECSSKHNRGVSEVFYETARVSLTTRAKGQSGGSSRSCIVM
ncbi:P-loop containing nucleoside triphosphate hydrolase protein [Lactifluus volemus]|nr:P-loop containing nucleoside triphosphate hydrolase protein [Lactifluus volemus]